MRTIDADYLTEELLKVVKTDRSTIEIKGKLIPLIDRSVTVNIGDTITIDGVQYIRKDLVENQEKAETQEKKPLTGYERAKKGESYWSDCDEGVYLDKDEGTDMDNSCYNKANYYTDETIAENNARADTLMRRLRQWQALNDDACDWSKDDETGKWYIAYSYTDNVLYSDVDHYGRIANAIYFSTEEKADEAIEVFRDELMWYFTEYRQRLDESERG